MIELQQSDGGVLLSVYARPKAKRNAVVGLHGGRLKVAVTQAPEKGKANRAILHVLASQLGYKKSQLRLIAGETSALKTVLIENSTISEVQSRIEQLLSTSR